MMTTQGLEELTEDKFYGQLDNIMMWCFTLGFNAARREYGDQYKSAREAEPNYEDNLDSWIQDIITSHEELLTKARLETAQQIRATFDMVEFDITGTMMDEHMMRRTPGEVADGRRYNSDHAWAAMSAQAKIDEFVTTQLKKGE